MIWVSNVHATAPDADTLMLSESSDDDDDIALEQAAEALAAGNEKGAHHRSRQDVYARDGYS